MLWTVCAFVWAAVLLNAISVSALDTTLQQTFSFPSFTANDAQYFNFSNRAELDSANGRIYLVPNQAYQQGEVWFAATPVQMRGFVHRFGFTIEGPSDVQGIAFLIHTNPIARQSGPGVGGIGYGSTGTGGGINNSIAFEFDSFLNEELKDPSPNHIAIHTGHNEPNSAMEDAKYQLAIKPFGVPDLTGGATMHNVTVTYIPGIEGAQGSLNLEMTPSVGPLVTIDQFQLESVLGLLNDGTMWVGFTASTGASGSNVYLNWWDFNFLGTPNATNSFANDDGLKNPAAAGSTVTFTVQSMDQYGNPVIVCGAPFQATFDGQPTVNVTMTSCNRGVYTFEFVPTLAGGSTVTVKLDGASIKGSPYAVTVVPGSPFPENCVASQTGSQTGLSNGTAGAAQEFEIQLKDKWSNTITATVQESAQAILTIDGKEKTFSSATATNGVFSMSYSLTEKGLYSMMVEVNNMQIQNANYSIFIDAAAIDASKCVLTNATVGGVVGETITFTIQMLDEYGNVVTEDRASTQISLQLEGPETRSGSCAFKAAGVYTCQYSVDSAGSYTMVLTVNGNQVPISQKVVLQPANSVWGPNTVAYGPNLNASVAGAMSVFYIQTKDVYGNKISKEIPETEISIAISFANGTAYPADTGHSYQSDGVYQLHFNITKADAFFIKVQVNGKEIEDDKAFPVKIDPGAPNAANCFAIGNGLSRSTTGKNETFSIYSYDAWDNANNFGAATFIVNIKKHNKTKIEKTYTVADPTEANAYQAFYKLGKSGSYDIEILLNGENIKGSPYPMKCKWAGLPTTTIIIIVVCGFCFIASIGAAIWIYRKKCRKHQEYTPLRDQEDE